MVTFDVTPKLADGGKRHLFKFSVKENELVSVSKYRVKIWLVNILHPSHSKGFKLLLVIR